MPLIAMTVAGLCALCIILATEYSLIRPAEQQLTHTPDSVYEFVLKDGTRCAMLKDSYAGGLTCDWNNQGDN